MTSSTEGWTPQLTMRSIDALNILVFGHWSPAIRQGVLDELHTRGIAEYRAAQLATKTIGELDILVFGHPSVDVKQAAVDELHGRALIEHAERDLAADLGDLADLTIRDLNTAVDHLRAIDPHPAQQTWLTRVLDELHRRAQAEHHSISESGGLTPEEAYAIECGNPWI